MLTTTTMTITVIIKTKNKFSNYGQPDLSDSKRVYPSWSLLDSVLGKCMLNLLHKQNLYPLLVHRNLKLQSQWKRVPLWKTKLNTTEVRENCLTWKDTLSLTKIYLKLITLCRYCMYNCWCSVWISCCIGRCWNICLVDLQEKEAQHVKHWR